MTSSALSVLREEFQKDQVLQIALHHESARSQTEVLFAKVNLAPEMINHWATLGTAVIDLYSARSLIGSTAWDSVGKASLAVSALKRFIYYQISHYIRSGAYSRFGDAMFGHARL